ncbi:MAG: helix-turn-helix domain-containing protein [Spirochaetales bacterium]|nr:helix-turn-helix domain-containing protein [Spirochaetales bacterium]
MNKVSFGKLFKLVRTEKNISQSELSYGICTPRTIYNIEKGFNIPSIELMLHFANKLGFEFLSILSYSNSENGLLHYKFFCKMKSLYENYEFEELEKNTDDLLQKNEDLSPYQFQILHWYKGVCVGALYKDYPQAIAELEKALSCTREQGIDEVTRNYCSLQELHILNSYGTVFFLKKDYSGAEEIFFRILNNLLKYGKGSNDPLYLKVSYNLAKCRNKMNKPKEALHVSMKAIEVAQKSKTLRALAELYIEKGNSHDLLGEVEERNRAFKRFIYLHELCGNEEKVKTKKERFSEAYGINFESI